MNTSTARMEDLRKSAEKTAAHAEEMKEEARQIRKDNKDAQEDAKPRISKLP